LKKKIHPSCTLLWLHFRWRCIVLTGLKSKQWLFFEFRVTYLMIRKHWTRCLCPFYTCFPCIMATTARVTRHTPCAPTLPANMVSCALLLVFSFYWMLLVGRNVKTTHTVLLHTVLLRVTLACTVGIRGRNAAPREFRVIWACYGSAST
jgi:hypothetical protein